MKWFEMMTCPHCGGKIEWNGGSTETDGASYDAICTKCRIFFLAVESLDFEVDEDPL